MGLQFYIFARPSEHKFARVEDVSVFWDGQLCQERRKRYFVIKIIRPGIYYLLDTARIVLKLTERFIESEINAC